MKKNQPPPLPQPTLSYKEVLKDTIQSSLLSFTLADDAIDRIVDKGTKILYNTYLRSKLPRHVSNFMIAAYTEAIYQEVMPYDPGESIDYLICNWTEDEEPEGTPQDSWSGQTAKIVKPRPPTPTTINNDSFISLNDPGSKRNSLVGRFRNSAQRISLLQRASKKLSTKDLDHVSERVDYLKQEYEVQLTNLPTVPVEEDKVVDQIRDDIALRKQIKQKKLDEQAEEKRKKDELKEKLKTFERQSKDNAFTFDYEGNVIFVTKQSGSKKKSISNYNLKAPLETLRRLPTDAPLRELEEEGADLKALSLLSTKKLTQEKYQLSKTMQFRDMFSVKPGVMLKMPNSVKQGPDFKDENRMRKDDFMKILEARKTERGIPKELNKIAEEEESEDKKREAESALMSQLRKLADLNQQAEFEIHHQDLLVQMMLNNTDTRKVSELYGIMKGKSAVDNPPEELGSARKSILEDRIVEYNRTGISEVKNKETRPKTTKNELKVQVSKLQQGLDSYNRNLLQKDTWGQDKPRLSQISLTPIATPRISPEKKTVLKASIFEGHAGKEPRERTTVGQKRAAHTARGVIDTETVSPVAVDNILSARGDAEGKKFIIKSSAGKEKIPDDFGLKLKAQGTKPSASKNDSGLFKLKASASVSSLSKSNQQTPRLRINV